MENLFSYGTLQRPDVQLKLFGRLLAGAKDVLAGYKFASIEITDEMFLARGEAKNQVTLVESKDGFVDGTVFEVSREELLLTDSYEPENYRRIKVALASGREAWIYLADEIS